ncbi:autotransporter outer membrane beta-barrel domain-containing protein [Piscirickettsia salmonis]|uniref:autotransporter outer membrane beta-barrel domain-containing protein n=1 Tax=Piscirickettsia salmonis TaxID=1238 RepID=UPI0007C91425|nr:Autotransporter beta-domain protein [Piscirickettsiaceae bacterium NZ-RLO1]
MFNSSYKLLFATTKLLWVSQILVSINAAPSNTSVIDATVSDDVTLTESGLFGSTVISRSPIDFDSESQTSNSAGVTLQAEDTVKITVDTGIQTDPTNINVNVNLATLGVGKTLTGGSGLGPITTPTHGGGGAALNLRVDADVYTNISIKSNATGGINAFGADSSTGDGLSGSTQSAHPAVNLTIFAGSNSSNFTENTVNISGNMTGGSGGNGGNSTFVTGSGGIGTNGSNSIVANLFENTLTHFLVSGNLTGGNGGNGGSTTGSGTSGNAGDGGEAFYLSSPAKNSTVIFDIGKSADGNIMPVTVKGGNGGTSPSNPGGIGSYRAGMILFLGDAGNIGNVTLNVHKGSTIAPGNAGANAGIRSASLYQVPGSNIISQVSNDGSITNGIDFSSSLQADVITNNESGVISGVSYTGLGDDSLTNSGTIESIDLGFGNDIVTNLTGGKISQNLLAGAGNDIVTNSSQLSGTTNLGSGDDLLEIKAGSVGSIDGGTGIDTLNIVNSASTAYINENCELASEFATLGSNNCTKEVAIANVETINVSSYKISINGAIKNTTTLIVNHGSKLYLNSIQNNQFSTAQVNQLNNMGSLYLNSDVDGAVNTIGNSSLILNEKDNINRKVATFTATINSNGIPSIQSGFYNDNGNAKLYALTATSSAINIVNSTGGSEKYINYVIDLRSEDVGQLAKNGTEYPILNGISLSNHDNLEDANFNSNISYINSSGGMVSQLPLIEFFSRPGSEDNSGSIVLVAKVKSTCDFIENAGTGGLENLCSSIDSLSNTYSSSDANIRRRVLEKTPVLTSIPPNVNTVYLDKILDAKQSIFRKGSSSSRSGINTGTKTMDRFSPWIDAYAAHEKENPAEGYDGYSHSVKGVSFGIDYNAIDKFGLFISYSENKFSTEITDSSIKNNSYGLTLFLEKPFKTFDYYASLSYFYNDFDNERRDTSKSVNSFKSSFSNHSLLFNSRLLYNIYDQSSYGYDLTLLLDLDYNQVMGYGYQEDYLNLGGQAVQSETWHQLNFGVGFLISKRINLLNGIITPTASVKAQYSVLNDPNSMNVSSIDFPGFIQVQSASTKKVEYELGIALKYEYKENIEIDLEYNSLWNNSRKEAVSLISKYRF